MPKEQEYDIGDYKMTEEKGAKNSKLFNIWHKRWTGWVFIGRATNKRDADKIVKEHKQKTGNV